MSDALNAGDLQRRITIQVRSPAQDELGQEVTVWTDLLTVWASLEPLSGRELLAAQAVQSEVSHKITIRWREQFANPSDLTRMRVLFRGRLFNIHSAVSPNEDRVSIVMDASEGLNPN